MTIHEHINISDDRLMNGLIPVVRIISEISSSNDSEVTLDFTGVEFVSPVFVLSMIVYLTKCGKKISIKGAGKYLEEIGFTNGGFLPDKLRGSAFIAIMEAYSNKTYIPIISFPVNSESDEKDAIASVVEDIIIRQLNIKNNVATGIKYLIEETIDNITEHSNTDRGFIFTQSYPDKEYFDLCIADRGITLLGSYKRLSDNEIIDDLEAIKAANRGISSKNRPDAENRGFGIYTSKKMLIEGLGGQYMMISGNSMYVINKAIDSFYTFPGKIRLNGTIVAFRIPFQSPDFNYINYIE